MTHHTVGYLIGSLATGSINRKLAKALQKLGPQDWRYDEIDFADLPLYNEDLTDPYPEGAQEVKRRIEAADAVIFVVPEYNRSVPGVLNWIATSQLWVFRHGAS